MDNNRQKELLELLAQAQEEVMNGNEVSTEFARVLFPPARKEYELTYYGKEGEQSIISQTFAVPLQENRRFGESTESDWLNKIIFGDNLQVLKTLVEMKRRGELKNADGTDGVRLVYIDPPFATKQDFSNKDSKAYSDKLAGAEFLEWLRKRLILLREVLADDGSIYVHLDWHKAHYVKVLMDEIFGEGNFRNEIVWHYNKFAGKTTGFPLNHDTLYLYTKNKNPIFNKIRIPVEQKRQQTARVWDSKLKKAVQQRDEDGNLIYYEQTDKAVDDTWLDIPLINPMAKERREVNYPTQKPEKLLERVIKVSSNEGDIVLDCFGGSGTTAAVAERLGRKWITVDAGKLSIYTIQKRILSNENHNAFAVDEYDNDGEWSTIFNILRVPYSMYQKFTENFKGTLQANDTESVNAVVDAYGFDFMRKPKVDFEITGEELRINKFESFSRLKGKENVSGFEAFSMLLVDLSYDNQAFNMDKVYYRKDFDENQSIIFDESQIDGQAMFIFVDKFGNEFVTTRGEMA